MLRFKRTNHIFVFMFFCLTLPAIFNSFADGKHKRRYTLLDASKNITDETKTSIKIREQNIFRSNVGSYRAKINKKRCRYSEKEINELKSRNLKRFSNDRYYNKEETKNNRISQFADTFYKTEERDKFHNQYKDSSRHTIVLFLV